MNTDSKILTANISMAIFLQAIAPYCDEYLDKTTQKAQKDNLTDTGKKAISKHIWKCYVPYSKMGKNSRSVAKSEAIALLDLVKHVDDIHLVSYYKNLSHSYLENIFVTVVFIDYDENQITEQLSKIIFLQSILKPYANNGSIDTIRLEQQFKEVLKGKKITEYINRGGKHPLASFMGINARTLKSFGGAQ